MDSVTATGRRGVTAFAAGCLILLAFTTLAVTLAVLITLTIAISVLLARAVFAGCLPGSTLAFAWQALAGGTHDGARRAFLLFGCAIQSTLRDRSRCRRLHSDHTLRAFILRLTNTILLYLPFWTGRINRLADTHIAIPKRAGRAIFAITIATSSTGRTAQACLAVTILPKRHFAPAKTLG
ncbi:hypothetical protein LMG918_20575 [Xanthomonas euvesicatoria]|nr:hypothetical protein LMG918_20575 [Xanthomonas euvesicatoria]